MDNEKTQTSSGSKKVDPVEMPSTAKKPASAKKPAAAKKPVPAKKPAAAKKAAAAKKPTAVKKQVTATPPNVQPLPLSNKNAVTIARGVAKNSTNKVLLSQHCRDRMRTRGISLTQILNILRSPNSVVTENAHQTTNGDWSFNLRGFAGDVKPIELVVVLKRPTSNPSVLLVTVYKVK